MNEKTLLTTREAAELLRVSVETVKLWARERRIPSVKLGPKTRRFHATDLAAVLRPSGENTEADR